MSQGGSRLYVGHLSPGVRDADLEDLFKGYGKIVDLSMKGTFAFVEFSNPDDADRALADFDGKSFMGDRLKIQYAQRRPPPGEGRASRAPPYGGGGGGYGGYPGYGAPPYDYYGGPGGYYGGGGGYGGRGGYPPPGAYYGGGGGGGGYGRPPPSREPRIKRGEFRLIVSNLPSNTSWQDLKDIGREHGHISFADIDSSRPDEGIIEYDNREDMERALDKIEGMTLRGNKLRIDPAPAAERAPPSDDRKPPPRDRSRSPAPRRAREDSREAPPRPRYDSRSPPPRRERDYE